ncbi:hypothetical protein AB395_00006270 (plasmid) [Sinorhizobium fredii CCBAU 45436]|nr:hypothetical protein AB395_00006270 [Sinorhizobium fredii CCBAU 45436]
MIGGLGLISISIVFWSQVASLPVLHGTTLGPGGLPKIAATATVLFGLLFCWRGFGGTKAASPRLGLRGLVAIVAAVLVFSFGLERLGLLISGAAAAFLAALGARDRKTIELAVFPVVLSAACALLFVVLLGVPVPVWPNL